MWLVTDELVEFEEEPVEIQDFRKSTDISEDFTEYKLIKKNWHASSWTWNTWGSQPIIYAIESPQTLVATGAIWIRC